MAEEENSCFLTIDESVPRLRKYSLDGRIEPTQLTDLDSLHNLMISTRNVRRRIVEDLLHDRKISENYVSSLKNALDALRQETSSFKREFDYNGSKISMNVKDEILSCQKDLEFLEFLQRRESLICLTNALAAYHPVSSENFHEDLANCRLIIQRLCKDGISLFVTDWDGYKIIHFKNHKS